MRKALLLSTLLVVASLSHAGSAHAGNSLETLARQALSEDSSESRLAIAQLRALGPAGLQAMFDAYGDRLRTVGPNESGSGSTAADPAWVRLRSALDAVSGQRDSYASRLYWYTDLEQAKAASKASGKPILSLRLLGRLDEDLSCANSRLFRITLYANDQVSELLRERFILHWKSVRPVPKVTIDFGDGRKLERTLTGNSIHYVLDSDGVPIDSLPGLYGPAAFLRALTRAEQAAKRAAILTGGDRGKFLRQYHGGRIKEIEASWSADLEKLGLLPLPQPRAAGTAGEQAAGAPRAERAARVAVTKMAVVERPVLRGILADRKALEDTTDDQVWARIGALHATDAQLDANTKALMRTKIPHSYTADAFQRAVSNLERAIAIDAVRNEYLLQRTVHEWFVNAAVASDVDLLNEKVYAELFLTPSSDPWLGLFPSDSYTGIDNEGIRR